MTESKNFWNWFTKNQTAYTFLASIDESVKEELLNNLLDQLHKYCDQLYFEIGGFPDEEQELVITAEGNKDYFTKVEELVSDAPSINGWSFVAFKQPTRDQFNSKWGDIELNSQDIWFIPLESKISTEIGIRVYVPNYDQIRENESSKPLLLKMIDTILGEKSFAEDLAYIEFESQVRDPEEDGQIPIIEHSNYIEWSKSKAV
ncbi:MAG TPA: hypothetical protein VHE34_22400 [Puia sp.]|uniref:hypothetical protein n=1 Tax=Puia sp. TaxID=2045100 RepID=UPI002BD5E2E7|nr:hypothetical protein [Puia sp.]HVU97999.1 hypothetical protein [Puia sp.]